MFEDVSHWIRDWTHLLAPASRVLLIVAIAWLLRKLVRALIDHLGARSILPAELVSGLRRAASFVITTAALLLILEQLGVSATVLWTGLTGFVAVAAIAFFAAWSVLSNIFCTFLIIAWRPFRVNDHIELLENGEKPGLRGQVLDVNLIYTTLREVTPEGMKGTLLQIPNSLFFQRAVRRWTGAMAPVAQTPTLAVSQNPASPVPQKPAAS
jgi:small-conductance mechanosensitive channel